MIIYLTIFYIISINKHNNNDKKQHRNKPNEFTQIHRKLNIIKYKYNYQKNIFSIILISSY